MPLQLSVPLEKEFVLEKTDEAYGVTEPTKVTIRQAAQSGHERRASLFSNIVREMARGDQDDIVRLIQRFSFEELKRIEVYLTLVGCNITDEHNKPLFKFSSNGHISESSFTEAWGKLPPLVATEIHDCVLDLNIAWRPEGEAISGEY